MPADRLAIFETDLTRDMMAPFVLDDDESEPPPPLPLPPPLPPPPEHMDEDADESDDETDDEIKLFFCSKYVIAI